MKKLLLFLLCALAATAIAAKQPNQQNPKDIKWVTAQKGETPKGAVIGGYAAAKPLYICRVHYKSGVHPGEVIKKGCLISYAGKAVIKKPYKVLVSKRKFVWASPDILYRFPPLYLANPMHYRFHPPSPFWYKDGVQLAWPVSGGHESGRPLYLCRGRYQGRIHIGKKVAGNCNIGWEKREIELPVYKVLFLAVQ